MPKLSKSVRGAFAQFSLWMANGSVGHPLLKDVDYPSVMFTEPSAAEQAYAIFGNVLELDEHGEITNFREAELRAAQFILQYMTGKKVEPPFEDWEIQIHE